MGVPTNYNKQEPQIQRRFDALNDLKYYTVKFTVKLTEGYSKSGEVEFMIDSENIDLLGLEIPCVKRFSALNDELAENNINEWLTSFIEQEKIEGYNIKEIKDSTLLEALKEKELLPLFSDEAYNEVLEKSKNDV